MKREVQGAVLLILGLTVLRLAGNGQFVFYVKPGMRALLMVSAVITVLLGAWSIWSAWRGPGNHDRGPRVGWLLLLPVATVFLIAPAPLGSYTAARQSNVVALDPASLEQLPPGDPVEVGVGDYVTRAVWGQGDTLRGRTIRMTGFVTPNPGGPWWITRLGLTCCAADAMSYRVGVRGARDLPANTWVEVTGRWRPGITDDIPTLRAERVRLVPAPENPYE